MGQVNSDQAVSQVELGRFWISTFSDSLHWVKLQVESWVKFEFVLLNSLNLRVGLSWLSIFLKKKISNKKKLQNIWKCSFFCRFLPTWTLTKELNLQVCLVLEFVFLFNREIFLTFLFFFGRISECQLGHDMVSVGGSVCLFFYLRNV